MLRAVLKWCAAGVILATSPSILAAQNAEEISERLRIAAQGGGHTAVYLQHIDGQIRSDRKTNVLRSTLATLFNLAPDGQLTQQRIANFNSQQQAMQRSRQLSQYLAFDLDGDGAIDLSERDAIIGPSIANVFVLFEDADTNDDDRVTFEEMLAYTHVQQSENRSTEGESLMLLDANQDGTVVVEDIIASLDALELYPLNLSAADVRRTMMQAAQPECNAPAPPENASLIVLSAYEGSALSTVSVVGPNEVTHTGQINIEDGDEPLYIFIGSHSNIIWDVVGATDRVTHLVVQKGRSSTRIEGAAGAGVVGLSEDKVHFVEGASCLESYVRLSGDEGRTAYNDAERNLGRAPDTMLSFYTVRSVSLPSGTGATEQGEGTDIIVYNGRRYEMTPEGPKLLDETEGQFPDANPYGATITMRSLLRFSPDGIRTFAPDDIVADGDVAPYDVYPQQAGLLQLILDGSLTYTRDGVYVIEKALAHFPAGLNGAHSVRFRLAEGVELPAGSPGHSTVMAADSETCLTRMCR